MASMGCGIPLSSSNLPVITLITVILPNALFEMKAFHLSASESLTHYVTQSIHAITENVHIW